MRDPSLFYEILKGLGDDWQRYVEQVVIEIVDGSRAVVYEANNFSLGFPEDLAPFQVS